MKNKKPKVKVITIRSKSSYLKKPEKHYIMIVGNVAYDMDTIK